MFHDVQQGKLHWALKNRPSFFCISLSFLCGTDLGLRGSWVLWTDNLALALSRSRGRSFCSGSPKIDFTPTFLLVLWSTVNWNVLRASDSVKKKKACHLAGGNFVEWERKGWKSLSLGGKDWQQESVQIIAAFNTYTVFWWKERYLSLATISNS